MDLKTQISTVSTCIITLFLLSAQAFRRVCYFTNWSCDLLEPAAHFCIKDIDPQYCSHLIYAFANINTSTLELSPTRPDDVGVNGSKPRYEKFNEFKLAYPELKTLLSVGGSLQQSLGFAKAVSDAQSRRLFSINTVEYLRRWNFDGLDLDWEYPGDPLGTKRNYTLLLHDLRLQFSEEASQSGKPRLLISIAAPVSPEKREKGFQVENVAREVDFINLMAYDFFGGWNKIAGFNSPLYGRKSDPRFSPSMNVEWTVNQWIVNGADRQKLTVGIAGYGVAYILTNDTDYSVGAEVVGPADKGPYRHMKGQLSYYEICEVFENATYEWDPVQKSPYAYINNKWVGYDNNRSVTEKVDWMVEQNLGGVMIWSFDLDDFKGTFCKQGKFPLLKSIHQAVAKHFPEIELQPSTTTTTTGTSTTTEPTTTSTDKPTGNDVIVPSSTKQPSTKPEWEIVPTQPPFENNNRPDSNPDSKYGNDQSENLVDDKGSVSADDGKNGGVTTTTSGLGLIAVLIALFLRDDVELKFINTGEMVSTCIITLFLLSAQAFRRVCYFTNWSCDLLEPAAHFCIKDIDPQYCSHLIYAFANINTSTLELSPTRPDDVGVNGSKPRYEKFNEFKLEYPELKTLLSVGGWLQQSLGFAKAVSDAQSRRLFSINAVEYLRRWNFDGLDLDWEYPGDPLGTKRNYTLLLHDLRLQFAEEASQSGKPRLLISIAGPASSEKREKGFEVENVFREVDFINLMAYDFFGGWNKIAGFNSPLYGRKSDPRFSPSMNVEWTVNQWIVNGADRQKLTVGIAGYGVAYILTNDTDYSVGAEVVGPADKGPYRHMKGQLSYYEICEVFENATYEWDPVQKSPYAYINNKWVGYDNNRSVTEKVDWMVEQNLGGVMIWSFDLDDFKGAFCKQGKFPLLKSIHQAVAKHFPEIELQPSTTTTTTSTSTTTEPTTTSTDRPTGNDVIVPSTTKQPSTKPEWEIVPTQPPFENNNRPDSNPDSKYGNDQSENLVDDKGSVSADDGKNGGVTTTTSGLGLIAVLIALFL
ncbi:hypothetical protein LOTGIDRAFT_237110 [Lottia gigantea]|uniref:GH18 domain-containing protein n=1 Tax=Lottia gigantea TaxID=225164 RepID=V3ZMZ8_LOTGI|nr:hypothetical protein LOTGIDRAFT_237110 [Lottia gigantea]ESO82211.1 hypothetical protein LOTGIDRAFT_237110 [Lottia gigantea]